MWQGNTSSLSSRPMAPLSNPPLKNPSTSSNSSSTTHHHYSSFITDTSYQDQSTVVGGGTGSYNTNTSAGGASSSSKAIVDEDSVRVWRDGGGLSTPYVGPRLDRSLRTPAAATSTDDALLCTPVPGRAGGGAHGAEIANSSAHLCHGESVSLDGSVRSSGPLDTTFMQHSEERQPHNGGGAEEDGTAVDVSGILDFNDCDGESSSSAGSPVIMRRFDGNAGWVDIPKRWLSPLSDRELAQLHAIQQATAAAQQGPVVNVAQGLFLSVGRSCSVAPPDGSLPPKTVFPSAAAAAPSSSSVSSRVGAEDATQCSMLGGRFRGAKRRGKAVRGERSEDDILDRMLPIEEDCGSPHRPQPNRRRRCETIDRPSEESPAGLPRGGFATVGYVPTYYIGTPQINRMMSKVVLRGNTQPRVLSGRTRQEGSLDTDHDGAPLRRTRRSASTDGLSATRGNYLAFVGVGESDDNDDPTQFGDTDVPTRATSADTVAARHLVFTDGHEELEDDEELPTIGNPHAALLVADRFMSALEGASDISRPLFEDDDERPSSSTAPSPRPSLGAHMPTLTSDDAPASRGSTQPPEEAALINAPRRLGRAGSGASPPGRRFSRPTHSKKTSKRDRGPSAEEPGQR